MEDVDNLRVSRDEYKKKMHMAYDQVKQYEEQVNKLKEELEIMYKKVQYAEQREQSMKEIMTRNITDSNSKINAYVSDIQNLRQHIKNLEA